MGDKSIAVWRRYAHKLGHGALVSGDGCLAHTLHALANEDHQHEFGHHAKREKIIMKKGS